MANQDDGAENLQEQPDSTIVREERAHSITPIVAPPRTEFKDFTSTVEAGNQEAPQTRLNTQPEHSGSYARTQPEQLEDMEPARRSVTEDTAENEPSFSAPKRIRTAPADNAQRPSAAPRRSTLLGSIKRRRTATTMNTGRRDPFEYKFEPISSDSESSLSSEDEEEAPVSQPMPEQVEEVEEEKDPSAREEQAAKKPEKKRHPRSRFAIGNDFFKTKGRVSRRDGRLKISINETANSGYVAKALGQSIRNHLDIPTREKSKKERPENRKIKEELEDDAKSIESSLQEKASRPRLNIVIMVIGSRGDIQPFLKIGKILRHNYGHRVRVASHPTFRDFVEDDAGLEFFSVGGDPSELMAFMVKNPGLIPNFSTVREGEISKRRASMAEMFEGFWRACINTTDDEHDKENLKIMGDKHPFITDAIIANPPSMAHVHIAERLGIPLHMMFTFPYSPTTQFPHPMANIKMQKSNVDANYVNFMSYPLVEMMTWQGLGDIVNRFRENTLRLEPVSSLWAPGALYRMKVPYTYLWSPALVPKPKDWGPEIDIGGFVFLDLASKFQPSKELSEFLNAGEPPVYIGFGSIVVDDPDKFTDMIFKGTEMAGVRALVNKGWGGFGRDNKNTPKHIFMLGNTPHDWLFPRVKAVVHHGGAGTTAIGLKCGKPTMIIPFFGDQPFWGAMVSEAKAGAHDCIPYKKLTVERLAEGIKQCLTEEAQKNVQKIADSIANEGDGAENAVKSFHRSLPLAGRRSMRCSILQDRAAVWQVRKSSLRLSALAAEMLHKEGKIKWSELKTVRHYEWNDFDGPGEPVTGGVAALTDSLYGIGEGFGMVPVRIARHIRKREEHERRKRERQKRKELRERTKIARTTSNKSDDSGLHAEKADSASTVDNPCANDGRPATRREDTNRTMASPLSADSSETLPMQVVEDLNWGLKRAGAAILTMPNDFHVAIAQGFHNVPRLWGDATVRKPIRITGVKSGFTAARKELAYGMYDGWTGLVKQPRGDWEDGETLPAKFAGLGTGIGKGLGGFVLKNANAVWAPPAFIVKGLIKYVEKKHDGPGSKTFIRRARIIQGESEFQTLQSQHGEDGHEDFRQIQERVDHGWAVYSEIWTEAHKEFGPLGGNVVGKARLKKEGRKWKASAPLENVKTADRALRAHKEGHEKHFFAKRKMEIREAEQYRTSAMDQPETLEEKAEVLANGVKEGEGSATSLSQVPEEDLSETTAVGTPDGDRKEATNGTVEKRPVKDSVSTLRSPATVA